MTITGLSGDIGSGKSWKMLAYALEQANSKQKYLVLNFGLNLKNLKRYCAAKKQWWNVYCIDKELFSIVAFKAEDKNKENHSLIPLFKGRENCIVCLDEAGIFLNARQFKNTPAQLLMDLAQSRKSGNDLIWAAQFDSQVDVQFRNLTQFWIHCDGFTAYDKRMRRPALKWKTYYYFKGAEYDLWQRSKKARTSFVRTLFAYGFQVEFGPLSRTDIMLFSAFDSFTRLENQAAAAREKKQFSLKTDKDLEEFNYYKKINYDRCRVLVKRGKLRFKTKEEKKVITKIKPPLWKPKSTFDWATELDGLDSPQIEEVEEKAISVEVLPPSIVYVAPQQIVKATSKKSLTPLPTLLAFLLSLGFFYSMYKLVDARIATPRRAPLAGGAGQTAQSY